MGGLAPKKPTTLGDPGKRSPLTKAFVKGDRYGFSEEQNVAQAAA